MRNFFLTLSGLIYGLIAALHVWRFLMKWPVQIGTFMVPLKWSLWAALVFLFLSLGCFIARGAKG